jgi:hypothetical protein
MADHQPRDDTFPDDMALIERLVRDLRMHRWPGDSETILEVGDMENTSVLAVRHGLFTFETTSRGKRSIEAVFSSARDARRYLIMDLAESFRFPTRMAPVVMHELAPGTQLEDGPTGHRLAWPGGEATFYTRYEAVTFSWVVAADPTAIVASYGHVNGEPLFDLGITPDPVVPERPPARIMDPPPIEPPPPDEEAIDHATIDGVLAELGWERRPAAGAEVLAVVGHAQVGRAISYRQSQFVYESVVDADYRKVRGTFSTAAAGRRFLLLEFGGILRTRRRLPRIRLNRLAPACTLEKGPTAFDLTWAGGQASFPVGYIGHQHALDFSWVVTAELADIAASYRHPNGEPLFDLGAGRA